MIDSGSILSALVTLSLAGVAGLAWIFKLQGDLRVLKQQLEGEIELRKALQNQLNGLEQSIVRKLERIEDKLDGHKSNRDE